MRLLMVVPRFGPAVVGGAETLVRALALRAVPEEHAVEVATTCAVDHERWDNALPAGTERDETVTVHRFRVSARDARRHSRLAQRLARGGRLSYLEELELMATSVWSADLQRFVEEEAGGYDLVICAPYLFGVPFWAAQAAPGRTALIPCLHDEPQARLEAVRALMGRVRGCLFNSPGERRLAERLYGRAEGGVVGLGLDPPPGPAPGGFAERHGLGTYLLYAGRIEEAKRVDALARHVARYRRERGRDVTVAMIGGGSWRPRGREEEAVRVIGFVDEREKRSAYAGALGLVNPSSLESLSIVLLEAWREGVPALLSGASEVLEEHRRRSGGGLAFTDYESFARALDALIDDPEGARAMGEAGRRYVATEYSWSAVAGRFQEVVARLAA